ncbi:MAG: type II toxin-antitoxin system RelE/ParE family toxin [Gemmataceae bacterium]
MPLTVVQVFRDEDGSVPLIEWLDDLQTTEPRAFSKCLDMILRLEQLGNELRRPLADMLRDGIYELRAKVGRVNYRILYFFSGSNVCCLSHGFSKEKNVPSSQIDLAVRRKRLVQTNRTKYTAQWEA